MSIQWADSLLAVTYAGADWAEGVGRSVSAAVADSGQTTPVIAAAGDRFPATGCGGGW
jgi:hypothetical protein